MPSNSDDATHVVQRMVERRITWPEIVTVVALPDKSVAGHSGRTNHYGVVNGRRIRVTIDGSGVVWTAAIAGRRA
jgi:hypothetical protein